MEEPTIPTLDEIEAYNENKKKIDKPPVEPTAELEVAKPDASEKPSKAPQEYETPDWLKPFRQPPPGSNEQRGFLGTVMDTLSAPGTGLNDYVTDELNKIPGLNLRKAAPFENKANQAVRELSSLLLPFIAMKRKAMQAGGLAQARVKSPIGERRLVKYLSEMGIDQGVGAYVDYTNKLNSFDDNFTTWVRKNWKNAPSFLFPTSHVITGDDGPDDVRRKNIIDGQMFGLYGSVLESAFKLGRAVLGGRRSTTWIPKSEKAQQILDQRPPEVDPMNVEETLLQGANKHEETLDEIGNLNLANNPNRDRPLPGIDDVFDSEQIAARSVDDMGIHAAQVDAVRIDQNLGSVNGRLSSMVSEPVLEYGLKELPDRQIIKGLTEQITGATFDAKLADGTVITAKQMDEQGTRLAEILQDPLTEPGTLRGLLNEFKVEYTKVGKTVAGLGEVGSNAVNKAIKGLMDEYLNLDAMKAQAYFTHSIAGQISDIAEGARYLESDAAMTHAKDRIFNRLHYLYAEQEIASRLRGQNQNLLNTMKLRRNNPEVLAEAARAAAINAEEIVMEASDNAQKFVNTLSEVVDERPEFAAPLMMAYEMSDGNIATMTQLNNWFRESFPAIQKYLWDEQPGIPNQIIQGANGILYNNTLAAISTAQNAAWGNGVLLTLKPLTIAAGAIMGGDIPTLSRAIYGYRAAFDTFGKGLKHFGKVFTMASKDPSSVKYVIREDLATKQVEQLALGKSFAEAASARGEDGPLALYYIAETLQDMENNPVLRIGSNLLSATDGFTRAAMGNIEARMNSWDEFVQSGRAMTPADLKASNDAHYRQMLDSKGMITDEMVDYQTREIALNLDTDNVRAFSNLLQKNPWMKTQILFPRAMANVVSLFGKFSPVTAFIGDYKTLVRPGGLDNLPAEAVQKIMQQHGLKNRAQLNMLRAEYRGRAAVGTAAVMYALDVWRDGRGRGDGSYDKARQRTRRQLNWENRTIQGDDGNWYSFAWLGPLGDWMALTFNVADNFYDGITENQAEEMFAKLGFVLSASITDKSMFGMMEPLFDMMSGNSSKMKRWAASYASRWTPLYGMQRDIAKIMDPALRELNDEFMDYYLNNNRLNPNFQQLPYAYDWFEGGKVGFPENPWVRGWNAIMPMKVYDGDISPEKQFLLDIKFDSRPSFNTGGNEIELDAAERSALFSKMGEEGLFKQLVGDIMKRKPYKEWKELLDRYRETGEPIDEKKVWNLYGEIDQALLKAKKSAFRLLSEEMQEGILSREYQEGLKQKKLKRGEDITSLLEMPK